MNFNITVGLKPESHIFFGKGSKYCFYINGVPGARLELVTGQTYTFNINATGHPFYFTNSEIGGSDDNGPLGGFTATDNGQVTYTVSSLPSNFYYQCKIHAYMGAPSIVQEHNTFYTKLVMQDLVAPTSMSYVMEDPSTLYIADQIGRVYRYDTKNANISVFIDVTEYTPTLRKEYDERGLLGFCFHPEYTTNGRFFIYYSSIRERKIYGNKKGKGTEDFYNCLSEFTVKDGKVLYEAEKVVLRMDRDYKYHNGGKIAFGPDGYLYITVGDGGPQGDNKNGQDLSNWFGKILRINVNTTSSKYYEVPTDNPFVNVKGAKPEIWAYGLRNPWGMDFYNNMLIVTDAGYETGTGQEEVNVITKGGMNFGWSIKEGSKFAPWTERSKKTKKDNFIDPVFSYTTGDPNFSDEKSSTIIGGFVDRKSGHYICADFSGRLIRLKFTDNKSMSVVETHSLKKWIRSFGLIGDQMYVLTSNNQGPSGFSGEIYALDVV